LQRHLDDVIAQDENIIEEIERASRPDAGRRSSGPPTVALSIETPDRG
jgi:hypothetical protein